MKISLIQKVPLVQYSTCERLNIKSGHNDLALFKYNLDPKQILSKNVLGIREWIYLICDYL